MKHSRLLANTLAAFLCFVFLYVASSDGQESQTPADRCLPYVGITWEGLSAEARSSLIREFMALPRVDYLTSTAMAYVSEEGFLPTEIMGPLCLEPDGRELLVAFREGRTYALDLPVIDAPLFPGLYWTSGIGSSWTVLLPDGETETYWVNREL